SSSARMRGTVLGLMSLWWASLRMWWARSSSDQCEVGTPTLAGLVVARTRTLCRSSGGKSGRAAAPGEVCQTSKALAVEAAPPLGNGAGPAAEFGRDLRIGGRLGA